MFGSSQRFLSTCYLQESQIKVGLSSELGEEDVKSIEK